MIKLEHVGIAVKDLNASIKNFEKILNTPCYQEEEVVTEKVKTAFFLQGNNKIELLEGTESDSPISKFIEKRGEGVHHIAFDTDDILADMLRLKGEGFTILNENLSPKKGADNKLVCFLHPKETNGVLIELCQEIND